MSEKTTIRGKSIFIFNFKMQNLFIFVLSVGILFITAFEASAQNNMRWVRGNDGSIPYNAVVGGKDSNGAVLYVCRTTHNGTTIPGKVVAGKCNYNWGNTEYSSGSFDILIGGGEYWTRDINTRTAVVGGSSNNQAFYVCRANASGGSHPGRMQDGKCNYSYGGRGYSTTNYEVLNSDREVGGATATISLLDAALRGDAVGVRAALKSGQAINQKNEKGQTALILAASKGANDALRVLLNEGAAVDARDNEGFTALMYAAFAGDPQSIRQLLRAGANLRTRTNAGNTAFYYAAASGSIETAQQIMNDQAFEGLESPSAGLPLHAAAAYNRTEMISFLLDSGELDINGIDDNGQTALMRAASGNKAQAVGVLIRDGADVKIRDNRNYNAVGLAAYNDASDALAVLIDLGRFNLESPEVINAFHIAAENDKPNVVKYLLRRGINVNIKDFRTGNTALYYASSKGHKDLVKILIENRVDVDMPNKRGETALMTAAANSETSILKMLIKAGADINLKDESGKTALQHAIENNHKDTRKELEKNGAML